VPLARVVFVAALLAANHAAAPLGATAQTAAHHWLDQPIANWNASAPGVPRAPAIAEGRDALIARCDFTTLAATAEARAVAAAGWIPYRHLDRDLSENGVAVVGGLAAADGMCRPDAFNLFVFVDGRFAGTLSPSPMSSRADGAAGAVRLLPDDIITAEFARYTTDDALCCPSSRVTVRFRISRGSPPSLIPVDIRTTRG
jgi:hypothetical protein